MDTFDVLLVDLQDLGCRIYTFVTTLRYVLEAAAQHHKEVWVLDRPNPVGRPTEGLALRPGWESFVGAGALPMRHGLTLGELAGWFVASLRLDVECQVVTMEGWQPAGGTRLRLAAGRADLGEPEPQCAEPVDGALLCRLGDARGHDPVGRPWHDAAAGAPRCAGPGRAGTAGRDARARARMARGCRLRPCWFEPTFNKHAGKLCAGFQVHVEDAAYYDHEAFRPWRLFALAFKALRRLRPDYPLWRDFPYEYEQGKLAIDVINGSELLRRWVDDPAATPADLEKLAAADEAAWTAERQSALLYR